MESVLTGRQRDIQQMLRWPVDTELREASLEADRAGGFPGELLPKLQAMGVSLARSWPSRTVGRRQSIGSAGREGTRTSRAFSPQ
jgi:hypothetical protein